MERYSDPCISTKGEGLKKGAWTDQEDKLLSSYIIANGEGKWTHVAKSTGLNRSGKSCRLRWLNYLKPDIKRGNITRDEEDLIIRLHKLLGNKWSLIAGRIPGRTDNEIKNYWNTTLSKKLRTQTCTVKTERNPSNVVIQTKPWKCKNVVIQHPPCPKENLLLSNHIEFQEADPTTTHFTNKCQNSSPPLPESRVVDVQDHHQFNRNENFDGNLLYLGNNDNALYTDLSNGQCHQTIDHVMFNDWSTSCLELDKDSIASWDMDSLAFLMESEVWDVGPLI